MAAIRFLFHSSLILLIAVINGCVCEYSQLTIQVSESGHDKLSCLQEPQHACKTLVYVLNQMSNSTFNPLVVSEVFINVTYNQTIHKKLLETFCDVPIRTVSACMVASMLSSVYLELSMD